MDMLNILQFSFKKQQNASLLNKFIVLISKSKGLKHKTDTESCIRIVGYEIFIPLESFTMIGSIEEIVKTVIDIYNFTIENKDSVSVFPYINSRVKLTAEKVSDFIYHITGYENIRNKKEIYKIKQQLIKHEKLIKNRLQLRT